MQPLTGSSVEGAGGTLLLRWVHPTLRYRIRPDYFILIVICREVRFGYTSMLDRYMFRYACNGSRTCRVYLYRVAEVTDRF